MNTAMILAAGRGSRLWPITRAIPKALCRVRDVPLIEHHIKNLVSAGFTKIVINHAYLGDKIRHYLKEGKQYNAEILYAPEPPGGLETGGGIYNALPLLGKKTFVVVNADIFSYFSFNQLKESSNHLAHLVLVPKPNEYHHGDFGLDKNYLVNHQSCEFTFSGIATYHPEIFQNCQFGRYSIISILRSLIEKQQVSGEIYQGPWIDIGSPERLTKANQLE